MAATVGFITNTRLRMKAVGYTSMIQKSRLPNVFSPAGGQW
ncbi:hypothetical protein HSR121_1779 [Halapricum desulfuricans]|uniref:Uncharacterized protein n=1 Tax=Halapricum desulfuricans TaxID=2841257 RepID=A0A897N0A1_9EURY|nr:hypothetical protein HSR121_1779 [Halapricum desulfuricans]